MRLKRSADELHLTLPINKKEFTAIVNTLIQKNPYENPAIRSVLTAGVSKNGIALPKKPTFYILIHDITKLLPKKQFYKNGASLITHEFSRDNHASKTTNYIEAIKKQKERNRRNAIEILYLNKRNILECTTANIFIIKNNELLTSKDEILLGITRKLVIKLAKKNNIFVHEQKITKKQLFDADEVFITGSAKNILPITKVDSQKIGNGKPGQLTQKIHELYFDYFNNY
jgi:branched-subunit amino acid aminotransferase/4-amino-4-deoxychorismate lyase